MNNKLNIEEIKYLIPDYITGHLNENEKHIVENAIRDSEEINNFYKEIKGTFDFAGNVKFEEPPRQYWNNLLPRIHQRIEAEKERKTARNPISILWKILVPVAAVILIFIVYQFVISPEKQIVNNNSIYEKKEIRDNNTNKVEKTEEHIEEKKDTKTIQNNIDKFNLNKTKRAPKSYNKDTKVEEKIANDKSNDNIIKETNDNNDNEDLASIEVDESSISVTGQAAGFDEEVESDLNKLDVNEQKNLLEQLSTSNM